MLLRAASAVHCFGRVCVLRAANQKPGVRYVARQRLRGERRREPDLLLRKRVMSSPRFFPDDRAVRYPVTGTTVGWFLIATGLLTTVVNAVKRNR